MVVGAIDKPAVIEDAFVGHSQIAARGVVDGKVVEAGRAGCRRTAIFALPGVQADAMMIAESFDKGHRAKISHQFKPHDFQVKRECALKIGDFFVQIFPQHYSCT
jgi:hypothetical protein